MNRMRDGYEQKFKCFLHCGGVIGGERGSEFGVENCQGEFVKKISVFGAVQRNCEKGWDEADNNHGWPTVVMEEEI